MSTEKTLHQRLVDQVDAMYDAAETIKHVIEECNEVPTFETLDDIEAEAKDLLAAAALYRSINLNA